MQEIKDQEIQKEIDLRDYLRVLSKRRWTIISLFLLIVMIAAVHTFTTTPYYQATARIVIEKENPNLVSVEEVMAVDSTGTDYYQTQYKIIESRSVAREVVERLNLDKSPEFKPEPQTHFVGRFKGWIRQSLAFWKQRIQGLMNTGEKKGQDLPDPSPKSKLVSQLVSRIQVNPIRNSRLVDVAVEAKDPALATKMANAVVQVYIDQNLETKLKAAKDAVKWLAERIEEEKKKVEVAENALLEYKEQNQIITDFSSDAENITAEKLAKLNARVVEAEAERVEAQTRYFQAKRLVNTPEMLDSIPEVLSNELIQEIKATEVQLYNRMTELSKRYGSNHPKMIALKSELAELKDRKIKEARRVVHSLRSEYELAREREQSLKTALENQKNESLEMNRKAIEYGVLRRQAESSRQMYELLIKRFKETSLTEDMKTGNIRVIDEAELPRSPVRPKKQRNLLLAVVLGLMVGVGMAFFLEYLDNTIKLPDEIAEHLQIPYLGPIPAFNTDNKGKKQGSELITIRSPRSTPSESFRGIRTGILFSSPDHSPQIIQISSAMPAEGKTLCAVNLAVVMVQSGGRVLLVDCDMRRPRIHNIFQVERDIGISGVLVGSVSKEAAVIPTEIENLDIIPSGEIPPNPSELLGSDAMKRFLDEMREKYDRIIIDSPPMTAVTDAMVLSRSADGLLLVIRAGEVSRQVLQGTISRANMANARILGAVLNGIQAGKDGYYYNYYQSYYYYYGQDEEKKKKRLKRIA